MCIISIAALVLSCASTKAQEKTPAAAVEPAAAVKEAPIEAVKPLPKIIQVKVWKLQSAETAFPDGVAIGRTVYSYDESGQLLKEEELSGTNVLLTQKLYVYKGEGTVEISTLNGVGEVLGKAVRQLKGKFLLKESLYNPKGELQSTEEYSWDGKGQKTRWSVKTSSGSQVSSMYTWSNGNMIRIVVLDAVNNTIKRFERVFGDDNLLAEENQYDTAGILTGKIVYTYEGKYLAREENQNPAGAVLSALQYKNDAEGNPVEIKYLDRQGHVKDVKTQVWQVFTYTIQEQ